MNNQIYPCLWFDGEAKAAADFYCSIFGNASIIIDTPMVVHFEIEGKKIMGLNGGPVFKKNPSISLFVTCAMNDEIENLYGKLMDGGMAMMALDTYPWAEKYAWVTDKFGMTWQLMVGPLPPHGQKINTSFLFVGQQYGKAKQAIEHYASIFPNSQVHHLELYKDGEPQPAGNLKFGHFTLNGETFSAMDGLGDHKFAFDEGVSITVECSTQEEIDNYWNKLIADGGEESMCGWLKDKFGVSWQIVPAVIGQLMSDPERAGRVMQVVMKMKKLDMQAMLDA